MDAGRWDVTLMGPLCMDSVLALHQPPELFRVSLCRHVAGTVFNGTTRSGRKYILSGACFYTVGAATWEFQAGDIADLPEGAFELRVLGSGPTEFVSVWELPAEYWGGVPDASQEHHQTSSGQLPVTQSCE